MNKRSTTLSFAVASILVAAGAARAEEVTPPDTSKWACSKCAFDKGYRSTAELGGAYASDASAKFGDYTGIDKDGGYVVAGAEGKASLESGYSLSYDLRNLGLDSREARIAGGKQGHYDFQLAYDRVPHRLFDTAETPFQHVGSSSLDLPAGWVRAGSTGGMTALSSSLHSPDVGTDRDRYRLGGRFWWTKNLVFSLDYRRDERDGTRPQFASMGSVAVQLLRPVSDSTDRLRASARYDGSRWFAQVGYYASVYSNDNRGLRFDNPFTAPVVGGDAGQIALPPDNEYQEITLSTGMHGLPGHTVVAFNAAVGEGTQDARYLPYTINPTLPLDPLPSANLDGKIKTSRADLTLSSRPLDKLHLRGSVAWDQRKNDTRTESFTSIVHTDLFPVADDRVNPVYGYDRLRLKGSADYDLLSKLSLGLGGEYRTLDRKGTRQEIRSEDTLDGWGRIQFRPTGGLGFVLKGGVQERDPKKYDTNVAAGFDQNPLLRKYELAYRYRTYADLLASVAFDTLPVAINLNGSYAHDRYMQSALGMQAGIESRLGGDVTWTINEKYSVYASAGLQNISTRTNGSTTFTQADWTDKLSDDFQTYGGGVRAKFTDKMKLTLDYTYTEGNTDSQILGVGAGRFPTITSRQDTVKAAFTYGLNERTDIVVSWWYEKLKTHDWAIEGIGPATMNTVLGLGIDPYNYDVNYVAASVRYSFGGGKSAEAKSE